MPNNKLVIRRLPPSMNEDDFLRQVSPLPNHDYFCFFEANSGLGPHSFSRAYIHFLDPEDVTIFRERFDNYIFLDKYGHGYPAVVEQSFWHKSPKNGPFYKGADTPASPSSSSPIATKNGLSSQMQSTTPRTTVWIEQDPDFIEFMDKFQAQKKGSQQSPIQTLETNLDELTNTSSNPNGRKDNQKVITPLIDYVNQKRIMKSGKKGK